MTALPQSADDLLRLVARSGLVPIEKIQAELVGQHAPDAALPFAKWLVQNGHLTTFQADQLLQGKSRGFFLGNYRVLQRLGSGGTAGVFLCEHKAMRHRAAVKVLSAELVQDEAHLLRFRREAQTAAALNHPNIVRTLDFDEDNGRHFLVMEYVEGETLDQWMKRHPTASLRVYVHLIMQAVLGLQHVHESGLIHRDLKPSNLLLDRQGTVKILDLGLAKFTDDRHDPLTQLHGAHFAGTVDFMSPEQADGRTDIDIRGDIFSLGSTLYYLLTGGQVPFPGSSLGNRLLAIQSQNPRPIREFKPEIDPLLEKIVERMMAKDPAKRFQSPQEAYVILKGWLNRSTKMKIDGATPVQPRPKPPARVKPVAKDNARALRVAVEAASVKPSHRAIWTWSLSAAALIVVVGVLLVFKPWNL